MSFTRAFQLDATCALSWTNQGHCHHKCHHRMFNARADGCGLACELLRDVQFESAAHAWPLAIGVRAR